LQFHAHKDVANHSQLLRTPSKESFTWKKKNKKNHHKYVYVHLVQRYRIVKFLSKQCGIFLLSLEITGFLFITERSRIICSVRL